MMWMDYNIMQAGTSWKVEGEWPGEVMGLKEDGSPKDHYLYRPGDVFVVNEQGWLIKTDELSVLLAKYELSKKQKQST